MRDRTGARDDLSYETVTAGRLCVIGLGVMGAPIARHMLAAGFDLHVASRSRGPVDLLAEAGATAHVTPSDAAAGAEVVVTVLPDGVDVREVGLGPDGVIAAMASAGLWIDMSTISPAVAREVAAEAEAAGISFVDAPVSGGQQAAEAASLTIMVGGSEAAVSRARPILEIVGARITHFGPVGSGQVAKAANQIIVGGTIALVAEALTLARQEGLDPAQVRTALLGGFAASRVLEVQGLRMIERQFVPGFRAALQHKDLSIAMDVGRSSRTPLPTTAVVRELFSVLLAMPDGGESDHSALALVLETLASATARAVDDG
jgi:2-hydroxy-3-oxopropionate reductase